ncbi:regulator of chromosome condensation (RCC1)-like protein [Phytophthora cinnamomi]|uniref:regulator of chromosome condensation (RCC1)-like protein n=1 Tax=Phytophthora cinnamomi TaxID=4785 RepID=UPI00355A914A|nr:regulator of chromosome condensation (RCC1)-like protein [Phytophthora cinnamomi]
MQPAATRDDERADLWACARTPEAAPALARLLRDAAPPDDRNDLGETALHVAAACGNDEAVQLLLRHGADLLAADWESGWTPLHRSLYHQHLSTTLLLLRHVQTRFGKTFVRKYLHETRDHAQQSPMQLLSTRLQRQRHVSGEVEATEEACDGGLVYTFGKRDYQLGYHLPNADVQVSPRLVELPTMSPIVQLSASKYHTIALNAAGECFVWGFGKGGRLGTGNEFDRIEPTRLRSLETTPMKKVAAGENHSMALSRSGQVFTWGSNSFGQLGHPGKSSSSLSRLTPKRVDAFRFHVVEDIAASGCHSAAIDAADGAVYTWGSNRRGQLGRKEGCGTDQADATPRSVDALRPRHPMCVVYGDYDSVRAEKVALSDWHTCVVLRCSHNGHSFGQVWQFGYGSYRPSRVNIPFGVATGSSGAGAIMCDTWVPTCKQRGMDIVEVSCAPNHSIALSASGSVYTWGHNAPALSHQSSATLHDRQAAVTPGSHATPSPSAPQKVELSYYGPVASVCASQDHCAVVTREGNLVTWGCGQQGVLGHGRGNTWQPSPKRVSGVKKAVAVAAGHQHTAVLVAPVLPDFSSAEDVAAQDAVPSLLELVERKIAAHVDVANCMLVWQYAERYAAFRLQKYCVGYMRNNWDAVLDVVGRDRLDTLFEIMLPPMEEPEPEEKARLINPIEVMQKPTKDRRIGKQPSSTKSTKTTMVTGAQDECVVGGNVLAAARADNSVGKSPITPSKPSGRRKSKNSKFVPLNSFVESKSVTTPTRDASTPWGIQATHAHFDEQKPLASEGKCAPPASPAITPSPVAASAFPEAFPLPSSSLRKSSFDGVSQRQRKTSIGSHPSASPRLSFSPLPVSGKHMFGYDGVEHEQVTAFSLDAFLKQPARRGARGKAAAPAPPTWSSPAAEAGVATEQKSKTLKEIQQEEEAAAAREREAKARLGGGVAPVRQSQSTVNSWGLFRPPDHVSLADVQKLQEEQEFLEQQRQILAEIEREQAAKARTAAAAAAASAAGTSGGGRGQRPKAKDSKKAPGSSRRARKPTAGGASAATAASDGAGDSQSKQNKQKKAKERKAARKAAGETFAAAPAATCAAAGVGVGGSSSSARPANRKRSGPQNSATASDKSVGETSQANPSSQPRPRRKSSRKPAASGA